MPSREIASCLTQPSPATPKVAISSGAPRTFPVAAETLPTEDPDVPALRPAREEDGPAVGPPDGVVALSVPFAHLHRFRAVDADGPDLGGRPVVAREGDPPAVRRPGSPRRARRSAAPPASGGGAVSRRAGRSRGRKGEARRASSPRSRRPTPTRRRGPCRRARRRDASRTSSAGAARRRGPARARRRRRS